MTTPYRDGVRPRLWRPGVLVIDGEVVRAGPCVGWTTFRDVEDWKQERVFVDKRTLPAGVVIPLPEDQLGPARYGRIRQAALSTPLVVVSDEEGKRLAALGARVASVGWHRGVDSGRIAVEHGAVNRHFAGSFYDLNVMKDDDVEAYQRQVTVDRILCAFSDGEIDEAQVALADALAQALADGGPRLDAWEAWLAEVFARADALAAETSEVAAALAVVGKSGVVVTSWGEVTAHVSPALVINLDGESVTLPAQTYFVVAGVADWRPQLPEGVFQPRREISSARRRTWLAVIFIVAGLLYYLAKR